MEGTCNDPIIEDAVRSLLDAPHLHPEYVARIANGLHAIDHELARYRATVARVEAIADVVPAKGRAK
jgi:hypothetical protein